MPVMAEPILLPLASNDVTFATLPKDFVVDNVDHKTEGP
jgi:hypothetical protein